MTAPGARRRSETGAGLVRPLAGAALLMVVGFAIGLAVGITWEEPSLVAGHLAGRTEAVELTPPVAAEPAERAATAPEGETDAADAGLAPAPEPVARAERPRPASPAARPPAAPSREPEKGRAPAQAAAAPEPGFAIQVGSFKEPAPSEELANRLRAKGYRVYVTSSSVRDVRRWRVRVGPMPDRAEADRVAARLQREDRLPTWIVAGEAGGQP